MSLNSVRRSQLIAPFGVGALQVTRGGVSVICCGLDHWYKREYGTNTDIDVDEFKVEEWRLQRELGVQHFRLPPDFRSRRRGEYTPNTELTVPFLRFPTYHYCTSCGNLEKKTLSLAREPFCPICESEGKKRKMVQVPFIALCDHGHIQDFPFREWVHGDINPQCTGKLRLRTSGGTTLAAQTVMCECGAKRNLSGITTAFDDGDDTYLSRNLMKDARYVCKGQRPWVHDEEGPGCGRPLRGSLRNASNVYFPWVRSSIYLPRGGRRDIDDSLLSFLQSPGVGTILSVLRGTGLTEDDIVDRLTDALSFPLSEYSDQQIKAALFHIGYFDEPAAVEDLSEPEPTDEDDETTFRREEYAILANNWHDANLKVVSQELESYGPEVTDFFAKVLLVENLRETRVLAGFTRIYPENDMSVREKQGLLWSVEPADHHKWLPATVVKGEGIFLVLREDRLRQWETDKTVISRVERLVTTYNRIARVRRYKKKEITPRFVLFHTFAHILMNRLTFECGYSSAALRERLYVSERTGDMGMAGVLIYTASGDSEGTMGGLVSLGKAGRLENTIRRAIEGAFWCSADPVCMEAGDRGGQGPDSCNLAACHNCCLVPETSCEEFNRFLDRGLVVGTIEDKDVGFFSSMFGVQ